MYVKKQENYSSDDIMKIKLYDKSKKLLEITDFMK